MCKMFTMITEPARKIPRRYTGISGDFPSIKNDRQVAFESLLERNYIVLLEFDDDVEAYVGQPITLPYVKPGKKPRKSRYTPDFIVYYKRDRNGRARTPQLTEVKTSYDLEKHEEDLAPKFAAAKEACKTHGWKFATVTEDHITDVRVDNATFLYRYLPYPCEAAEEQAVLDFVDARGGSATGNEIFDQFDPDDSVATNFPNIFWRMVANKILHTNWDVEINIDSVYTTSPERP